MRALLFNKPNEMELRDVAKPEIGDGEALIAVKYVGICGTDVTVLHGGHKTAKYPVIPGHEFVGELAEIKGPGSERFQIGDRVCAQEVISCGHCVACARGEDNVCRNLKVIGVHVDGGFAEYVRVKTNKMYKIPDSVDFPTAAIVEPLAVAVHDVRMSGMHAGDSALVVGGGPIGMLISLVLKASGARKVVILEPVESRREAAKRMGFEVVDHFAPDFEKQMNEIAEEGFSVSFETAGAPNCLDTCLTYTMPTGTVVSVAIPKAPVPVDSGKIFAKELTLKGVRIHSQYSFIRAIDLLSSGIITEEVKSLIGAVYPLEEAVEAFDQAEHNKSVFKVVIKV